jgi:hypothetical protein
MAESKADPFRLIASEVREASRQFKTPNGVSMTPDFYTQILAATSRDNLTATDPASKPQVFGLDVVIDPTLGPNEFELRY